MEAIFFNGWSVLGRTLLIGVLAYVSLVFMLRVSGKRTLAKMNAFDLVVTVAIGSTLATIVLSRSVALAPAGQQRTPAAPRAPVGSRGYGAHRRMRIQMM